jgi:5'-3' exoribonuclease 2
MGIPSYYRKLKDSVPGLVYKQKTTATYGLYFDFNCLVYHCLRNDSLPSYLGEENRIAWENALIEIVAKYVQKLVAIINPTHEVLICVDGVVPFAKMKQQRLRRFKSALAASTNTVEVWDRNAITPGTAFMERLGARLHKMAAAAGKLKWIVQDASVPGEGEQKIMAYLRSAPLPSGANIVIYGLDADLIVLSMLLLQNRSDLLLSLFRENVEFGETIYDSLGNETYVFLDMNLLEKSLLAKLSDAPTQAILNYAMAMSFLGNDFLPHALSQKMSEEGHIVLLELLKQLFSAGKVLINEDTTWNIEGVRWFLEHLSLTEDSDIFRSVRKKILHNPPITAETGADFYPAEKVEGTFFEDGLGGAMRGTRESRFKPKWRESYYENYFGGGQWALTARLACRHYFEGLHWIRNYYLGGVVAVDWYYPFFLPPFWKDLVAYIDTQFDMGSSVVGVGVVEFPAPQEQLTMVLPLESFWLIRDKVLRKLPYKAPQYWPISYTLFSCGKKWMWECEAQIPLLTLRTMRRFITD